MKGTISELLTGTAILIGIYLFVRNASGTTSIINSLGNTYTSGVKALQGNS